MILPNISKFIKHFVIKREKSFFDNDLRNNKEKLSEEIHGKSILVIGGATMLDMVRIHLLLIN